MRKHTYKDAQRASAITWKSRTETLPDEAKLAAPYVGHNFTTGDLPFCLPTGYASYNLLPEVRDSVLALFAELAIPWHDSVEGGPSNHLLDSQVQCANALGQMVDDPDKLIAAFGSTLDIAEVLPIEPGRFLTFEFISAADYFGEGHGKGRTRGAFSTSVDAAFRYRTTDGRHELALVEWKNTEEYLTWKRSGSDATRRQCYGADFQYGPLRADLVPFADMLDEPFYQLMRQQLLAARLETDPEIDAAVVRVVHVLPPANIAYQQSLTGDSLRSLGNSVSEVWPQLLRQPDRFVKVDPDVFLDPAVTSEDYVQRYAPDTVWDEAQMLMHFDATDGDSLSGAIDFEGYVTLHDDQVELNISRIGRSLKYPFRIQDLYDLAAEIKEDESAAEDEFA